MTDISKAQKIINNVMSKYYKKTGETLNFTNMSIIYKPYDLRECINIHIDYNGHLQIKGIAIDIYNDLICLLDLSLEIAVNLRDSDLSNSDLNNSLKDRSLSYKDIYIMWNLTLKLKN